MLSKNEDRIGCVLCVFAVFYLVLFLCTFIYFRSHVASVCLLVRPPVCTRMLYTFCVHFHSEGTCCVKCVCLTKEYRKFFVSCVCSALFFFAILLLIWISLVCFLIFRVRPSGGYYATGASSSSSSSRETKKRRCVGNSHRYTYASQSRMNKKKNVNFNLNFLKAKKQKNKKNFVFMYFNWRGELYVA